ncbi:MAG: hypothetical protein LBF12_06175, partial [Christensenellaceae bacterium]|nr:hypothetical protein [Christensenellaceae bacterium]
MWAAVQNQRVDFSIANVTMNNVIVETARTQFRPYSTSGTTYNCNTGISSPSSHWGTQVIRSVALNGNPDMAYSIANPSELNTSNSAMSLKAAGTPTTAPNFAYSGFSGKRFTPTSNKIQIDLEVKLAEHFQSWWTMGTFMYITSSPTIVLNMKYKTSNIEFKTNNAVYGNVIIPNYDNSPKSSITFTPSDLNSMNGDYLLAGQAVPNNGYVFLYWKKAVGDTEEKNIYNLSFNTTRLYNHNYNDATDGKIVYEAIFDELKITDLINNTTNYVYNGVGQGPRIFVDYPFTDINHQVVHSYKAQSGTTFTSVNVQINSTTQSLEKADTDLLIAKIPRNSGSYVYTAEVKRLINGTYTTVGLLNNNREINFSISRYTPTASVVENDVTLAPYYYGQKISSSYLISPISTTFNSVFLKDSYIRGENNQIIGEITGSYSFENNTYNTGTTRLISTVFGATIKFVPIDPNIETIILSGSINIGITKTTLKLGYVDPSFNLGISNLQLNVLTYGQTRDNLGVQNKIVLYNPYTYDDPIAIQDPQFTYVPYQISSWGIIDERPATTEQLSNATLQFTLSGNMPESVNSWNTVYNLPTEQIEVKYQVNKASLVFSGQEDQKLTFKYNDYKNATNTVYSNIVLMYGQGLKAVTITPSGTIASNVQGYIDSGIIKFAWYKQNEYGGQGESMSDYYEQKLLTVLDSTNPYGATKNYYCIKADWMIVDGSTENSNYEPIYFYNQSITITKAKLNDKSKFEQSTESGDETKPVIKWITYGEHVNNALSTNVNVGTTLNIVNQDLEVYYKIEWITDSQGGSIAMLTNYPYALVENSSQYAVKITILKWNGSSYVTDSDNYEQNGVFARNETGGAFAYASLVVTRATQQFYLEVDNSLVNVTNSNLIKSMINVNDNIFEEKTENLVIESDKNIDLETIYIATNNQFKIVIYTSAVIYKGEEILSITGKAAATLTAFYPAIYNVTSEPVVNYSIECFSGIPYSKIEFTITLSPRAADPGVLSLRIGQYDSGFELSNPTDGNYFSKEWNPAISESDPFTIFIKINKNPKGIKPQNIYNPDDNSVEQLYSYKEYYGSSILIEPLAAVPGTLSYPKNDGYITITQDLNATNETYLITSTTIGSYKLLYTAPGHVNLITPLNDPYMPINQEIWIYFAKKQSTVNILIDSKTATKYTYGELSPTVNYGTVGFLNDDFDAIKALIKLYFMSDNSDYKSNVILNAKEYFINASIDFDSTNISGIDNETLKNAREIAKRYNITFNPVKIEVEPKTIIITFTDSSQFTIDNEIKIFEIDYFDDNLYDANNYPYTYTFVGILEGEDLNEVIGDELTRPSVRAMNTTNSVEYYPISARPSAGSYEIQKYEPDNCPAVNYTFNIERAILRVKTRDVTLDFDEAAQNYTSSSYTFESNARFSGIEGATSPTGNLIIKFLKTGTVVSENTEFLTSLQHAGVYDVYVSYLSGNLDNYNNTDKVFSEYIIINRIDPIVTLPSHNSTYDGIQITYPYNIRGIAADYTLPGETLVYYSTNGSDYSES